MILKTITRKKTHQAVKEELLNSLRANDTVEESRLNPLTTNVPYGFYMMGTSVVKWLT